MFKINVKNQTEVTLLLYVGPIRTFEGVEMEPARVEIPPYSVPTVVEYEDVVDALDLCSRLGDQIIEALKLSDQMNLDAGFHSKIEGCSPYIKSGTETGFVIRKGNRNFVHIIAEDTQAHSLSGIFCAR